MAAAVTRDVIIVLGALLYRFWFGPLNVRPSVVSKFNTLCQAAFILAVVGREEFSLPPAWVVMVLGALVFVTVAVSGIDYLLIYGRRALGLAKPREVARGRGIRELLAGSQQRNHCNAADLEHRAAVALGCGRFGQDPFTAGRV